MGFWSGLGKIASIAAPIVAAPFTGGATLALIGAGAGAAGGALGGGGWKGAAFGAGMGAVPGLTGAGKAAGAAAPGLKAGLSQAGKSALTGGIGGNMATGGSGFWDKWGGPIMQGAGLGAGIYAGKKATSSAMQRSPEELAALTGASGAAGSMGQAGQSFLNQSRPYIQQPASYYQTLLSGNRAAMSQAVAPAAAQISGNYRGAQRGLEQSGVRGAARDFASGELNRQRVSQIAGLTTGVQGGAADALAGLGLNTAQLGAGLSQGAGNIYSNLLGQGSQNRRYGREEGEKAGKAVGGLVADLGKVKFGGKGKTPAAAAAGVGPAIVASAGKPQMRPPTISTTASGLPTAASFPAASVNRVTSPLIGSSSVAPYDPTRQWGSGISF